MPILFFGINKVGTHSIKLVSLVKQWMLPHITITTSKQHHGKNKLCTYMKVSKCWYQVSIFNMYLGIDQWWTTFSWEDWLKIFRLSLRSTHMIFSMSVRFFIVPRLWGRHTAKYSRCRRRKFDRLCSPIFSCNILKKKKSLPSFDIWSFLI